MKVMKLELKHLAPYLPYGLQAKNAYGSIINIWPNHYLSEYNEFIGLHPDCKILLRPLSDLTKEIEHNGEKFVPMEYILSMTSKSFKDSPRQERLTEAVVNDLKFGNLQYKYVQKLFEWHFDVFGLIPEGLAIDINNI